MSRRYLSAKRILIAGLAGLLLVTAPLVAQRGQTPVAPKPPAPLDRSKIPPPGKAPVLNVPSWTQLTLANGASLLVSEKRDLPLISFTITFVGGADQFEPAGKRGIASLTASMFSEGTKTRDGEALSNALQLLGTNVSFRDRKSTLLNSSHIPLSRMP